MKKPKPEPFCLHCYQRKCRVKINVDTDSVRVLEDIQLNLEQAIRFLKSRKKELKVWFVKSRQKGGR